MISKITTAGNSGPKVRSDCEVTIGLKSTGEIRIDLTSRVKSLYGDSIISLVREVLAFFGIRNAEVKIVDSGALPFVIAARVEAAVKKLTDAPGSFLPEVVEQEVKPVPAIRRRYSRLYVPGNTPSMMINAGLHSADGIILDLEDSVAPDRKDEARILVRNALRQMDFRGAEKMVRINQGEMAARDLEAVVPNGVNLIIIPKCESPDEVVEIEKEIASIQNKNNIRGTILLMPVIESAMGVENCFAIARASANVVAMAIGLEDYTTNLGVQRTAGGNESAWARARLVNAAKAAGIQSIDSVFSDVGDMEALRLNVAASKALGFEGMGAIHPRQVPVINNGFAPGTDEIEKAKKIVLAFDEAKKSGLGVAALGTKMIDKPVAERAIKLISIAVSTGRLSKNWKKEASGNNNT